MTRPLEGRSFDLTRVRPEDVVVFTARTAERVGAVGFRTGYEPPEGREFHGHNGKPAPEDDVMWFVEVAVRRKVRGHRPIDTPYRGRALVPSGHSNVLGLLYACVDLLEQLGATVTAGGLATREEGTDDT